MGEHPYKQVWYWFSGVWADDPKDAEQLATLYGQQGFLTNVPDNWGDAHITAHVDTLVNEDNMFKQGPGHAE